MKIDDTNPFPSAGRIVRRLKKDRPVTADDVRRLENALRSVTRSNTQLRIAINKQITRIEELVRLTDAPSEGKKPVTH